MGVKIWTEIVLRSKESKYTAPSLSPFNAIYFIDFYQGDVRSRV
jgi:hypothetical protein